MRLVLGLTGPNAAGKGEAAAYLRGRGFSVHSLSDIVREEAAREGLPAEREHLIATGNRLRREGGPGVLAERILDRLGPREIVDSIRNPAEVSVLRRLPGFWLIGVVAPEALRFGRSRERARPGDPSTPEQFRQREAQENSSDPSSQRLQATLDLADRRLNNDRGLEGLHRQIDDLLDSLKIDPATR